MSVLKLLLYADGGCNPNPGEGSFGVVGLCEGRVVYWASERIGPATNNIAEWRGAIRALSFALSENYAHVELMMDSMLVVMQLVGRWKVRARNLQPLAAEGRRLLAELNRESMRCRVSWVPRESNRAADRLATEARL